MTTRLDKLVAERFGLSRRAAMEAIRNGRIDLEGERCDEPGRMVEPGAALEFFPGRPRSRKVITKLRVLHEDNHLIVVDKPAGLLTLPTAAHESGTLLERVSRYLSIRRGGKPYVGIVHRLDKDTSGALALARSPEALRRLQVLFRTHEIERQYLAVVEGTPPRESGTIDRAIASGPGDVRRSIARSPGEGRRAVTHYRLVERFGPVASLLACWLETGRTHQIRIHLASIGLPVLGDKVYPAPDRPRCKARFGRQALHARTLGFRHPFTGEPIHIEAPLPADMDALVIDLRNRYGIPNAGG
ncbi:MAG: RluA family pseudouridine synthase [Isosphaeraceae bacterium]